MRAVPVDEDYPRDAFVAALPLFLHCRLRGSAAASVRACARAGGDGACGCGLDWEVAVLLQEGDYYFVHVQCFGGALHAARCSVCLLRLVVFVVVVVVVTGP